MQTFEEVAGYLQLCMQLDKFQTVRTKGPHDEPYVIEHIYGVVVSTGAPFPGEHHGLPGLSTPPCDTYVDVKIRRTRLALVINGRDLHWFIGGWVDQYVINQPESWEKACVPGSGANIYRPRFEQPPVAPTAYGRDGRPGPLRHLGPPEDYVPPQPAGAGVVPFDLFGFKYGRPGGGIFPPPVQSFNPLSVEFARQGGSIFGPQQPPNPPTTAQAGGPPAPAGRSGVITDPATLLSMSISRLGASASRMSDELDRLRKEILALEWHNGEGRAAASKASSGLF